jgi:general secretion pathway protein G
MDTQSDTDTDTDTHTEIETTAKAPPTGARRRKQRGMTLLEIMIVLAIIALVMGFLVGPRVLAMFSDSKNEVARAVSKQFSDEAYPIWSAKHSGTRCPASLNELLEYTNKKDTRDPWGIDYRMMCGDNAPAGARGMAVQSAGEDGKFDTGDDLKSWE